MVVRSRTAGELVFNVFGPIAQFERRLISERTIDGLATRINLSPARSGRCRRIRIPIHQAPWYRQINSLQGHQKHGSVIFGPPSFLLDVNLLTNLPMGPPRPKWSEQFSNAVFEVAKQIVSPKLDQFGNPGIPANPDHNDFPLSFPA